jgi:hypothetical protein
MPWYRAGLDIELFASHSYYTPSALLLPSSAREVEIPHNHTAAWHKCLHTDTLVRQRKVYIL